jgi:hypothetical protein
MELLEDFLISIFHRTRIISETTVVTLSTQYITVYVDAPTPVQVPSYASACSGSVRYASACSCAGITADVTTLLPSYTEITYTNTIYQTPITTRTITESNSGTSRSSYHSGSSSSCSHRSSSSSTWSHKTSSSSIYHSSSRSSSVSTRSSSFTTHSSSSSTPSPTPECNIYEMKATSGNFKGQVLEYTQDYNFPHTLFFTPNDQHDSSFLFTLTPDGRINGGDGQGAWVAATPSTNSSLVHEVTPSSPLNSEESPIVCVLEETTRALLCEVGGVKTVLQTCGYDNSRLAQGSALGFQCDAVDLVAVPACI